MCIFTGNFDSIFFRVMPFLNLDIWPKWKILLFFLLAQVLNTISWNFVVIKDIMCRCAYPQDILMRFFFSFWTSKFDDNERYYWNSWSAQLHWNRNTIALNFVVIKDIRCKYAFLQEMLIWFEKQFTSTFIHCIQHSWNVGAWGMWACSLFLSFFINAAISINLYWSILYTDSLFL